MESNFNSRMPTSMTHHMPLYDNPNKETAASNPSFRQDVLQTTVVEVLRKSVMAQKSDVPRLRASVEGGDEVRKVSLFQQFISDCSDGVKRSVTSIKEVWNKLFSQPVKTSDEVYDSQIPYASSIELSFGVELDRNVQQLDKLSKVILTRPKPVILDDFSIQSDAFIFRGTYGGERQAFQERVMKGEVTTASNIFDFRVCGYCFQKLVGEMRSDVKQNIKELYLEQIVASSADDAAKIAEIRSRLDGLTKKQGMEGYKSIIKNIVDVVDHGFETEWKKYRLAYNSPATKDSEFSTMMVALRDVGKMFILNENDFTQNGKISNIMQFLVQHKAAIFAEPGS